MSAINAFLLKNNLRIVHNPCISPDFCLDWPALQVRLTGIDETETTELRFYHKSGFDTAVGHWTLIENAFTGDCAWRVQSPAHADLSDVLEQGVALGKSGRA